MHLPDLSLCGQNDRDRKTKPTKASIQSVETAGAVPSQCKPSMILEANQANPVRTHLILISTLSSVCILCLQ